MSPLERIALFERDLVVQAGAGTGKTHALVTLYLHLIAGLSHRSDPVPSARIAVVTFTDKAAGELRERIRARLGALERGPDAATEPTLLEASARLGRPLPPTAIWAEARAALGSASIGTFHAFAGGLLRRHAARAGVDPDYLLLDEAEMARRTTQAAERAILAALDGGDEAVGALIAEYGYHGSGRGQGVVEALRSLRAARAEEGRPADGLAAGYSPERLERELATARRALSDVGLALGALVEELGGKSRERARELSLSLAALGSGALPPTAGLEMLRELGLLRGRRDADDPVKRIREEIKLAYQRLREASAALRAAAHAHALERLVGAAERTYAAYKRQAGAVDFADLLVLARDLLRDDQEVRRATRARLDAVLVDEFQDTNPVQGELIDLVAGPPGSDGGRRFVVGDRKQSIYEFRGADVAVFTRAAAELIARGGDEVVLRESRRALPAVLRLSNALFARAMVPEGAASADWDVRFEAERDALEPHRDERPEPGGELILLGSSDEEKPRPSGGELARLREARAIAWRIRALHRDEGRSFGSFAVLLRRFTHLPLYLDALRAARLPYYVVRGRGFFAAQEVRDLASALTLLDDPEDAVALVAVLRSPLVGLSDETLVGLGAGRRLRAGAIFGADPSWEGLAAGDVDRLGRFRAIFRELRLTADRLGPAAAVETLLEATELRAVLAATRDGEQRVANLERLIERARTFQDAGGDLRAYVGWLRRAVSSEGEADLAQAQVVDERDDVVRVMTVHQSKGLEFPIVFVPACGGRERQDLGAIRYDADLGLGLRVSDPLTPGEQEHTTASRRVSEARRARTRAESLRLFYVAATRARDRVIFSGEVARKGKSEDSWRAHLDAVAADSTTASLLAIVEGERLLASAGDEQGAAGSAGADLPDDPARPAPTADLEDSARGAATAAEGASARAQQRVLAALQPLVARPASVTAAVTQLADFALCPRRYHQFHALELMEHPTRQRGAPEDLAIALDEGNPPLDPLRRGTLAHRLLERCDFARGGADLEGLIRAEGHDPADPVVAEVVGHVRRFLSSAFGKALDRAAVRRELPFLLAVPLEPGRRLFVRGQIDLLLLEESGVTVVDYKHSRVGDPEDYRFQLQAYALAAHRLYPDAPAIHTGLAFLKEADPSPSLMRMEGGDRFEAELAHLGVALLEARARDQWEGRPIEVCDRLHCGYVYRCHPEASARH